MALRTPILRLLPLILLSLSPLASADVLDDILERGTIRFGVAEFIPWTMKSEAGDLVGFEIDLANKLAKDMGVKAEFELYKWDDIIPAVQRGDVDVITGGMSITAARALQVNFSRPVAETGVGLVTNTIKTSDIQRLPELNNPKIAIAVVDGTLGHSVANTLFANADIRVYPSAEEAAKAVVDGDTHAYSTSTAQAKFLVLSNSDAVDLPMAEPLLASSEAMAIKKGEQELLNFLNAWVTARQSDKWIATTRDYWFETLDWTEDIAE
jgi:polar amino acid transport system substrate-binding protein